MPAHADGGRGQPELPADVLRRELVPVSHLEESAIVRLDLREGLADTRAALLGDEGGQRALNAVLDARPEPLQRLSLSARRAAPVQAYVKGCLEEEPRQRHGVIDPAGPYCLEGEPEGFLRDVFRRHPVAKASRSKEPQPAVETFELGGFRGSRSTCGLV